jgi:hypothetical protein
LISLGLLRGQLNDSDIRRQQKREYQSTRFHIGKLIGFQRLLKFLIESTPCVQRQKQS